MPLATRLALATVALLVACLGLALTFATWRANDVTSRKIEDNLRSVVPGIYQSFERGEASARRQQVRSLAEQPGTKALLAEAGASPETCHDSAVDFAKSLGAGVVFLFDGRGRLLALDYGLGHGFVRRLALVQPHLERAPKILTGYLRIETRPARLELHHAHVVVALAVAAGVALRLVQRP